MDTKRISPKEDLRDEDQRRMDQAAERTLEIPAIAAKLREFDDEEILELKRM